MFLFRASFLTVPLYRSSRVTAIWWATSRPLGGPLWRECGPIPKNISKISIGLCMSVVRPPSLIAFSPPRSYNSRFLESDRTSYAWEIALNCSTDNKHMHLVYHQVLQFHKICSTMHQQTSTNFFTNNRLTQYTHKQYCFMHFVLGYLVASHWSQQFFTGCIYNVMCKLWKNHWRQTIWQTS